MSRVAISAHRGGGERYQLATWEAYRWAIALGTEYVEFDVRRLADGTLVCYHDEKVHETGSTLRTLTYRQLCAEAAYQVPTVPELMEELAGSAIAHVDLKETGYEAQVVKLATELLGEDGFVATSLEDESISRLTQTFPRVTAALSLGRDRREIGSIAKLITTRLSELFPLRRLRACGARWVAVDKTLARAGVLRACARHDIKAMVWTVDDTDLIDRFLSDPRVHVLVTNRPEHAAVRRARLGR